MLYPAKTIYYLLGNRVVSAGMLSQSLLGLFAERNDWVSQAYIWVYSANDIKHAVELTLRNVLDIPEVDLVKLLCSVQKDGRPFGAHDMEVDGKSSDASTFPSILAACISYPTSDAALRLAIKEQLNDPENIVPILTLLDDWLAGLSSRETSFILDADAAGNDSSVVALAEHHPSTAEAEIPPFDKVRP